MVSPSNDTISCGMAPLPQSVFCLVAQHSTDAGQCPCFRAGSIRFSTFANGTVRHYILLRVQGSAPIAFGNSNCWMSSG